MFAFCVCVGGGRGGVMILFSVLYVSVFQVMVG